MIVLLNVIALVLDRFGGASPGPPSSSYTTAPEGAAAYAELLAQSGHPVIRLRAELAESEPPASATLMLLDPGSLSRDEGVSLRRFVEGGGRLVTAGPVSGSWLEEIIDSPPTWESGGDTSVTPLVPSPEVESVSEVTTSGDGSWADAASTLPILGSGDGVMTTAAAVGEGRFLLLADASPLRNNLLAEADNAAFGLGLAGEPGRPVAFVESVHGYGEQSGLAAIPTQWKWMLAGLVVAALIYMFSRGRRLGPPQLSGRELPPPRSEYVEALAGILARARDPQSVAAHLRASLRREIGRRGGLPADAPDSEFETWAGRFGLDEDEARAVARPGSAATDLLLLGRALARLRNRKQRGDKRLTEKTIT